MIHPNSKVTIITPHSSFYGKSGKVTHATAYRVSVDFGEGSFVFLPSDVQTDWFITGEDHEEKESYLKQVSTGATLVTSPEWAQEILKQLNLFS